MKKGIYIIFGTLLASVAFLFYAKQGNQSPEKGVEPNRFKSESASIAKIENKDSLVERNRVKNKKLVVTNWNNGPLPQMSVHLVEGLELIGPFTPDTGGVIWGKGIDFESITGAILHIHDHLPIAVRAIPSKGNLVVTIPQTARLQGKIFHSTIDFGSFEWPLELQLLGAQWPGWLPPELHQEVSQVSGMVDQMVVTVQPTGEFQFAGLPRNWTGVISIPNDDVILSAENGVPTLDYRSVAVTNECSFLSLRVESLPVIAGRIVDERGNPIPEINVSGSAKWDSVKGNITAPLKGRSGIDGRFSLPLKFPLNAQYLKWVHGSKALDLADVEIEALAQNDWIAAQSNYDFGGTVGPWEVGDLVLKKANVLHFRLVDRRNNPIEGAYGYSDQFSEPSDSNGIGKINLGHKSNVVHFGAKGFEVLSLEVPQHEKGLLRVSLANSAILSISWDSLEENGVQGKYLVVRRDRATLAVWNSERQRAANKIRKRFEESPTRVRDSAIDGRMSYWSIEGSENSKTLTSFMPGETLRISIRDAMDNFVSSEEVITLNSDSKNKVDLKYVGDINSVKITAIDELGNPIKEANLIYRGERGNGLGIVSDDNGDFPIIEVPTGFTTFLIKKPGFASSETRIWIYQDSALPFVMKEGRSLAIRFKGRNDESLQLINARFWVAGFERNAAKQKDFGFLIDAVPTAMFEIEWMVGGIEGHTLVPRNEGETEILIESKASVNLHVFRFNDSQSEFFRLAFLPPGKDYQSNGDEDVLFFEAFTLPHGVQGRDFILRAIKPGRYSVCLLRWTSGQSNRFIQVGESLQWDLGNGDEKDFDAAF